MEKSKLINQEIPSDQSSHKSILLYYIAKTINNVIQPVTGSATERREVRSTSPTPLCLN